MKHAGRSLLSEPRSAPTTAGPGTPGRTGRHRTVTAWTRLGLVALVVGLGVGLAALMAVPATFSASTHVLLMPSSAGVGDGGNPYLANGQMSRLIDILNRALQDDDVARNLERSGIAPSSWSVSPNRASSSPSVIVTATSPTATGASQSTATVADQVAQTLDTLQAQAQIAPQSRVTLYPNRPIPDVSEDVGGKLKSALAAALTGFAIMPLAVIVRSRRRASHGFAPG